MDITNLDAHMWTFVSHPDYLAIHMDLARQYRLPVRLRSAQRYAESGRDDLARIVSAATVDLLAPDNIVGLPLQQPEQLETQMIAAIQNLKPGVTEYVLHASAPGDELTALAPDAAARVEAYRLVTESEPVRQIIESEGITLIGFRELRDAQRAGA